MNTQQQSCGQLNAIGARLREERERLGVSQSLFASHGGVQRGAQAKYESGDRQPDAGYLSAVAAHGVDVAYVLTGRRSANASPATHLRNAGNESNESSQYSNAPAPAHLVGEPEAVYQRTGGLDPEIVRAAVEQLTAWLERDNSRLPPAKMAEAVLALCELSGGEVARVPEATARVLRLVS